MNKKYYKRIAKDVLKTYEFSYLWMPKKTAATKCAKYLYKCQMDHPKGRPSELPIIAKNFFITINNFHYQYAIH